MKDSPTAAVAAATAAPRSAPPGTVRGPAIVWYPHIAEDEWSPCQLVSRDPGGGATLKIQRQNVVIVPDKAHLICPSADHNKDVQNLASLRREGLAAEDLEDALRSHFCSQLPYTNIESVTLFVNPFRELPIHDSAWIEKYSAMDESLPPHIYNAAAKAYSRGIDPVRQDQVIILLGEAASGKSRAFDHLLRYFVQTSGEGDDDLLGKLPDLLRPLLSVRCQSGKVSWSSTRALLSVELGLAADGFLACSAAKVELLEAGRAAREAEAEGLNFEALYLAAKESSAKAWIGERRSFRQLGEEEDLEDYDSDGKLRQSWSSALEAFGMDLDEVVRAICGILLLGEIEFQDTQAGPKVDPTNASDAAAKALGVQPSALTQALLADAGAAGTSAAALTILLEALHRRLVEWVLQRGNKKLVGEGEQRGNVIRIVEVPAMPNQADQPGSFDMLGLQWLSEEVKAELLSAVRRGGSSRGPASDLKASIEDLSDTYIASTRASSSLAGLARNMLSSPTTELASKALAKWTQDQDPRVVTVSTAQATAKLGFQVTGASGTASYAADGRIPLNATAAAINSKVMALLSRSSCPTVAEICSGSGPSTGFQATKDAVDSVGAAMRAEGGQRPWLVCCLRPNEKCSKEIASKPVLLRQVRGLRLLDMVQLSADPGYTLLWPLRKFREIYAALAPSLTNKSGDIEVCQLIVRSAGGGQGLVGNDTVYGNAMLRQILDTKLRDLECGSRSDEQKKQAISQMVDKQQDQQAQQELLQKQQQRQREEFEKLRQKQQNDLEKLKDQFKQQQQLAPSQRSETAQQGSQQLPLVGMPRAGQPPPRGVEAGSSPQQRKPRPRPFPAMAPATSGSAVQMRNMAEGHHAALHAKLSQMAAVLRVAKEREVQALKDRGPLTEELELLRQERDAWRAEADRLWKLLQDLQQRLAEG